MKFHWWWVLVAVAAFWIVGWFASTVFIFLFDPTSTAEEKRTNSGERLMAIAFISWLFWPAYLPAVLSRRKLQHDMRIGKRPSWIVLDKGRGEESAREWKLSDGTKFSASVSSAGSSAEPADISCDYEDELLTGEIQYRFRMTAPTPQQASEWTRLEFTPRGPRPNPDNEDAVDDYVASRYEASVKVARGKYEVEFRVPNRSGKVEECSAVTLIVADPEDYNL